MQLTKKQIWVMSTICEGYFDPKGNHHWLDFDQLLEKIPYRTSKQSMQFTLRVLTRKYGLVCRPEEEVRRGKRRRIVAPTPVALRMFKPKILRSALDEDPTIIEFTDPFEGF